MNPNDDRGDKTPPAEPPPEPSDGPKLPGPDIPTPPASPTPPSTAEPLIDFSQIVIEHAEPPSNTRIILTEPGHDSDSHGRTDPPKEKS